MFKIGKDRNLYLIDAPVWPAVIPPSTAIHRSTMSYSVPCWASGLRCGWAEAPSRLVAGTADLVVDTCPLCLACQTWLASAGDCSPSIFHRSQAVPWQCGEPGRSVHSSGLKLFLASLNAKTLIMTSIIPWVYPKPNLAISEVDNKWNELTMSSHLMDKYRSEPKTRQRAHSDPDVDLSPIKGLTHS